VSGWGEYLAVFVLGVAVGLAEILSRYREAPLRAAVTKPGLSYVALNGLVSLVALWIFGIFNISFNLTDPTQKAVARVVVAGFGALTFFRSSFTFRTSDNAVSIGPGEILDTFFVALDLEISRSLAAEKATFAVETMAKVDYSEAEEALPILCIQLLRGSLGAEDQSQLGEDAASLAQIQVPSEIKKAILGVMLLNAVGKGVLEAAARSLVESRTSRPPDGSASA
jgi:hypothetical protein